MLGVQLSLPLLAANLISLDHPESCSVETEIDPVRQAD